MQLHPRLQRWLKPRFAILYPFCVSFFIFCSSDDISLRHGIGYIIVGLLIRLWSNSYAIKNDKLTTCGPYAFVRNPLYLGTILIIIGFLIVLKIHWIASIAFLIILASTYYKTIEGEQKDLLAKYKDSYKDYCAKVPSMIPSLIPYAKGEKWPCSIDRLIFSKEYKSIVWVTVILIIFHLKTRVFIEFKPLTNKSWMLIFLAIGLILTDIVIEMNKKKIVKK